VPIKRLNVADAGLPSVSGSDVTTASLSNKSTTPLSRRRTALHYDSESSSSNNNVVVDGGNDDVKTTSSDRTDSTLPSCTGHSEEMLPPVSCLFADRESQNSTVAAKVGPDQMSTMTTTTTTKQAILPQIDVAPVTAGQTPARRPPPTRKRPPRVRKQSKRSRVNRIQNIQQQQQLQQQNGLLIMQKLLGSMTSLLRRDVTPLMTSFPVVTCSQRSPATQSLPLSMFCAGAVGRQMPCGLLGRPNFLTPSGTSGPLVAGSFRGPVVRPVVWPSMVAGGSTPGRRAPATANASTSAPLLASSRSGRQKTSSSAVEDPGGSAPTVDRLELMTVAALRDECRRRRLPTGGPKPNLIRRLQQNNFDAPFSCVTTSSYVVPSQTLTSINLVQSSADQRQPVAPRPVVPSSMSKSSSTTTTTASSEARASLSQSQAIVARILSIRAAQRHRNAELSAAACSATSSSTSASCCTSAAVVSSIPVTVGPSPRAPTSEVLTAISRTMCVPASATLPPLNQAANIQRPAALTSNMMSSVNPPNSTESVRQMMALTAYKQQQLNQSPSRTGKPRQGDEDLWRLKETGEALVVRQQQQLGRQGQGQQVKGQTVAQRDDLLRVRDAQSQVTLCRQQQMLIYELRRQLEQSRRALIEAQAGEPPRRLETSTDVPTSPTVQTSVDTQISVGACSGSVHYTDVVPTATCVPGLSFSLPDSHATCSSSGNTLHQLQQKAVNDDSLAQNHSFTSLPHDIQLSLQPTQHMLVVVLFVDLQHYSNNNDDDIQ